MLLVCISDNDVNVNQETMYGGWDNDGDQQTQTDHETFSVFCLIKLFDQYLLIYLWKEKN